MTTPIQPADMPADDEEDDGGHHNPHARHGARAGRAHAVVPGHLNVGPHLRSSARGRTMRSKIKEQLHGPLFEGSDDAADFHS